jgi:hypothetical protein
MSSEKTVEQYLHYGRSLVASGSEGMKAGRQAYLNGKPLGPVLSEKARASLGLAAVGACAGLVQYMVSCRRRRVPASLALSAAGSVIGFVAGFAWKTRDLTGSMLQGASRAIETTRDEHWLETHPIDYA